MLTKRCGPSEKKFLDCWNFPGGSIRYKETPESALHREVLEELNIKVKIINLIPCLFTVLRPNWHGILICFLCKRVDRTPITLNNEASEYKYFQLHEIRVEKTLPYAYEIASEADRLLNLI